MAQITEATADNFVSESKEGVVILDFYAPWCGPCKMITPILERIQGAKVLKINIDVEQELAIDLNISAIPHIIMLVDGAVATRFNGVPRFDALQAAVNQLNEYRNNGTGTTNP
jgi:thioredoxin 1